jgi:spermidine synthase
VPRPGAIPSRPASRSLRPPRTRILSLRTPSKFRFPLVLLCFVLSGFAGLIYETVWMRQFAVVFGTSELAVVTVLAAYMAGLALGAALAGRWVVRVRRPILLYAGLELGIGVAAVLVPVAINLASRVHVALLGGGELPPEAGSFSSALFYLVSSFAILLVPTALMGATLPLLARWSVRSDAEIGRRIGPLYAANTLGAAAGTLAAAFMLLPRIGLGLTILVAAAVNVLVSGMAAVVHRTGPSSSPDVDIHPVAPNPASGRSWILALILISGAMSFSWEILWTRLLSSLVGGSMYAFGLMLATFLVGIAAGSAMTARFASTPERARRGFAAAQIGIGGLSLGAFALVDRLPSMIREQSLLREDPLMTGAVLSAATLFPAAIAIGATFPLAVRCLASGPDEAARASARVFAWNTVGAIAGALATGYLVLPGLGFANAASAAAVVSFVVALMAALLVRPRLTVLTGAALAGLVVVPLTRPDTPWEVLRTNPLSFKRAEGEIAHYAVGRSGTILLIENPQAWWLTTNGLPESAIESACGRANSMPIARWLSLLPVAARPDARSLLVVGLGAGVTIENVPASVERIHVVEIEPEVVAANRRVAARRRQDPLADPRLQIHVDDARGALRLTGRRFDAIVSQPSHPWTSGASHLFTREFMELVRDRLEPGGVFVQWMGLPFVDEVLLRSMVATAVAVFPYVEVYRPDPGGILLLAGQAPLEIATNAVRAIERAPEDWAVLGVRCIEDVFATRVLDAEGTRAFAAGARPITDSRNLFQTRSPRILRRSLSVGAVDPLWAPFDPLVPLPDGLHGLYLVRRLIWNGELRRAERLAAAFKNRARRHAAIALTKLATGDEQAAEFELREALRVDPHAREALDGLLALYQPAIRRGEPVSFADRFTEDPETALIEGWRRSGASEWRQVADLEPRLAAVDFRHPLFVPAIRLRAGWRIDSGEPGLAREAITLIEPLLSPLPRVPDLLLRARAAAAATDVPRALASLGEALPRLQRGSELARMWHQILRSLPRDPATESWRRDLEEELQRPLEDAGGPAGPEAHADAIDGRRTRPGEIAAATARRGVRV